MRQKHTTVGTSSVLATFVEQQPNVNSQSSHLPELKKKEQDEVWTFTNGYIEPKVEIDDIKNWTMSKELGIEFLGIERLFPWKTCEQRSIPRQECHRI